MKWSNLKNSQCPKCGSGIIPHHPSTGSIPIFICKKTKELKCDFHITQKRFESLVNDLYRNKPIIQEEDNLSELNNL